MKRGRAHSDEELMEMGRYALEHSYPEAAEKYGVSSSTVSLGVRLARLTNKYGERAPGVAEDVRYWQGRAEAFLEVIKLQLKGHAG